MVTAGAGTSKTHVMINRVMFLLSQGVRLKDIIMNTFTNEATDQMRKKLQEKLISLAILTGRTEFIEQAEEMKKMHISTIHLFSK